SRRPCWIAAMPALTFLAAVGLALIALLFVADATLEPSSPPIVTSNRVGLPAAWHPDSTDSGATQNLATTPAPAPAPAPDMGSDLVRASMPKSQAVSEDDLVKVKPAAHAARAEVPLTKKGVPRTQLPAEYRQNNTKSYREFGLSGY